jgi:hypothetical protein
MGGLPLKTLARIIQVVSVRFLSRMKTDYPKVLCDFTEFLNTKFGIVPEVANNIYQTKERKSDVLTAAKTSMFVF